MAQFNDPIPPNPADGVVRGDDKALPDRGTSTGFIGRGAPYGASVDPQATNRMGSAHKDGDPAELCYPKGDADLRFTSSGHTGVPGSGARMQGSTDSDRWDDNKPDDQRGFKDTDND